MSHYVETQTKDGATLRIEVAEDYRGGAGFAQAIKAGEDADASSKDAYGQTLDAIRACAKGVIDTIQELETQPSGASIDFGIKIDVEAGAMIAKSIGEGQFKINLSWRQSDSEAEEGDSD